MRCLPLTRSRGDAEKDRDEGTSGIAFLRASAALRGHLWLVNLRSSRNFTLPLCAYSAHSRSALRDHPII